MSFIDLYCEVPLCLLLHLFHLPTVLVFAQKNNSQIGTELERHRSLNFFQ